MNKTPIDHFDWLISVFENKLQEFSRDEEKSISIIRDALILNNNLSKFIKQMMNEGNLPLLDDERAEQLLKDAFSDIS